MMLRSALAALAIGAVAAPVLAADLGARKAAPAAPAVSTSCKETSSTAVAADAFGFSTGSDVSDVGAWAVAAEYNGAFNGGGFKTGRSDFHLGKIQASTAFIPCWEVGPYILGTSLNGKYDGVTGSVKYSSFGAGIENKYKVFGRATHGFGLTLVFDPNVQGFNQKDSTLVPNLSFSNTQYNSTYKILLDKELITGKLWGVVNVQYDQIWTGRSAAAAWAANGTTASDYLRNSNLTFSGALSYQAIDGLFVGAETRYVRTHTGSVFNNFTGDALFVGPTFYWQATKALAVSGTWGVQVAGNAKLPATAAANLRNSDINLVTANQHIAKFKIAYGF